MRTTLALLAGLCSICPAAAGQILNEIRIDQPGADDEEYCEIAGPPDSALDGLTLVVIGDHADGLEGVIEEAVSLQGAVIGTSGFFLIAEDGDTFGAGADLIVPISFENSDNLTFLLVEEFTGAIDQDLDLDDDGILEEMPWSAVIDCVALIETVDGGDHVYCATEVGPDGTLVPGHAFRCAPAGLWTIGPTDPSMGLDTPGAANSSCPEIPPVALTVAKSGPTVAVGGATVTYVIEVSNSGREPAANVLVSDILPAGMTFEGEKSPVQVALVDALPPDIVWSIRQVLAGETLEIQFAATIPAQASGTIENTVEVSTTSDDDPADNSAAASMIVSPPVVPPTGLTISEIRLDQPGADNDEYFELRGPAGTGLQGLSYLVIGDRAIGAGSGVVEMALPLAGGSVPADEHYLVIEDTMTLVPVLLADLLITNDGINFENGDNVTHLLVANLTGGPGLDLDTNDDGLLDVIPWTHVIDAVGIIEEASPPGGTEFSYAQSVGFDTVGPFGGAAPGHVYRCTPSGTWAMGPLEPSSGEDTPGAANLACTAAIFVTKSGPVVAVAGATGVYTLSVFNVGRATLDDIVITDTLPAGLLFLGESSPISVNLVDDVGPVLVWQADALPPGAVDIDVAVTFDGGLSGQVVNTVSVTTATPGDDPKDNTTALATMVSQPVAPPAGLAIVEVRADQAGSDVDEYFELTGAPFTSLQGLAYVVLGDGAPEAGSGVVEAAIPLSGLTIAADGRFLAVEDTFTLGGLPGADLVLAGDGLNFEDEDNVTHLLVANFTGGPGLDLDVNDDGTLGGVTWSHVLSGVGLIVEANPPTSSEFSYAAALGFEDVGPDEGFAPGHVYRCAPEGTWTIGAFDVEAPEAVDTPGTPNALCDGGLPSCPGDTNGDGQVDVGDLTNVIISWGGNGQGAGFDADLNDDGVVNVGDLTAVITNWGACG